MSKDIRALYQVQQDYYTSENARTALFNYLWRITMVELLSSVSKIRTASVTLKMERSQLENLRWLGMDSMKVLKRMKITNQSCFGTLSKIHRPIAVPGMSLQIWLLYREELAAERERQKRRTQ